MDRRTALRYAGASLAGLAGCLGRSQRGTPPVDATPLVDGDVSTDDGDVSTDDGDVAVVAWKRRYGEEGGEPTSTPGGGRLSLRSVVRAGEGFALAGDSCCTGPLNVALLRTGPAGNRQWYREFGYESLDRAESLVRARDGGFLVAGETSPAHRTPSAGDVRTTGWVIRTDERGRERWRVEPASSTRSKFYGVCQTSDGGFALAGFASANRGVGGWFVKLTPSGEVAVERTYDRTADDPAAVAERFESVVETSDGGLAFAGRLPRRQGCLVLKTDAGGEPQWESVLEYPHARARDVVATSDGGLVVTGRLYERDHRAAYTVTDTRNPSDLFLSRLDAAGRVQWTRGYDAGANEAGAALVRTADGGYAVTGASSAGYRDDSAYLVETDGQGVANWGTTAADGLNARGEDVVRTADGGYAVAASTVFLKVATVERSETPTDGVLDDGTVGVDTAPGSEVPPAPVPDSSTDSPGTTTGRTGDRG